MIFRMVIIAFLLLLSGTTHAQRLVNEHSPLLETFLMAEPMGSGLPNVHGNIRPFILSDAMQEKRQGTLQTFVFPDSARLHRFSKGQFFEYNKKWFGMQLDPIYHSVARYGTSSGLGGELIAGVRGNVYLGKNFIGHFSLRGGIFRPVLHMEQFMNKHRVDPGQGSFNRHTSFNSFFDPSGYVAYSPSEHFTVQAGYDKLFMGNGYRSLFLSDNANQYPFLKLDTRFWRLRYVNIWANFRDIRPGAFPNKLGTFHYLSLNIAKRFNIGVFESIIWQGADSTGVRGFELNYMNPIIFYRPIEFSLNSPDNVVLGLDFRYRIGKNNHLYGQLILDELVLGEAFKSLTARGDTTVQTGFWGNKQAFQVGIKGWNLFWLKDLYYQIEFNWVRPFTYTHVTIEQNYGHYNQPLAHPKGANFLESVNVLRYRKNNWLFEGKFIYANYGLDTNNVSYGGDIYRSYLQRDREYGHRMTQGLDTKLYLWQFRVEYVMNAFWDLRILGGFTSRVEQSAMFRNEELYFFFGISSDLTRPFDDF
ncbi:MAG: hypothetical protein EP314_03090 [Bacteroidetes bacterium]|nr:MAG: hypothetical protein EP314_03090 [Bacteroidota bacterium]